ncbi:MAG TPA: response regulator transcription factor [Microthrixaceae bacterium]|nr:response regulator transcription factor [Microthrixaceae bacterium]HQF94877.1 response regulator transcription factor [Microthrixaceae bacterium]
MRVLVIEDEVALADAVARGLEAEGFEVVAVHDGLEGLEKARAERFDLIVLDIMLPGMNGYKVCRTLRDEEVWTPILMLTAKDGEYDEAEALDTGADDFLSKPFSFVVLVARLRALARRRSDANLQPLELGDLVLEPVSRTVRRGDTDIPLSPREFALLEALMRHTGEVVAKTDLLERVWGEDFEGDPNVVEVYIGYLRRKIDRPFGHSDLETVRGEGYRMGAATHSAS